MIELIREIFKLYWPPDPDWRSHSFRFHLAQSVAIVALWLVAWTATLWLVGSFAFLPHVAWASDVKPVAEKVDRLLQLQLQTNISQQVKDSCQARRAGNQHDLDTANGLLADLIEQYDQIAKRPYTMPSCDTVLVESRP